MDFTANKTHEQVGEILNNGINPIEKISKSIYKYVAIYND